MRTFLLALFIGSSFLSARSQNEAISDSLLMETCHSIVNSQKTDDSLKIIEAFDLHLANVFSTLSDSSFEQAYRYVFIRLQKFCPEFKAILDKINPPKDDFTPVTSRPQTKLNKKDCRDFLKHKSYYYVDQDGDTIHLTLDNNLWIDHLKDGTYSKLKFNWTSDTEFEITFIESTNELKKNLSKPGEKYRYELINKFPEYYLVFLNMPEFNVMGTFRIYYK